MKLFFKDSGWPFGDLLRKHRARLANYGLIALALGLIIDGLFVWTSVDFLVGKRRGIARVLGVALDVLTSAWFARGLQVSGTIVLISIYRQVRGDSSRTEGMKGEAMTRQRETKLATLSPAPQSGPSPSSPPAPTRIAHEADCPFVYLLAGRQDDPDRRWLRVTTCQGCGARVVDDYAAREMERGPEGWAVWHGENELLNNLTLGVGSLSSDRRRIYRCDVTEPVTGEIHTYNAIQEGRAFFGDDPSRIEPRKDDVCFYPQKEMFPTAPGVLRDGVYRVEWRALAENGPGDYFLKDDAFEIKDGRLTR